MSIRQFWFGRDSWGAMACFKGGHTPQELGPLTSGHDPDALSMAMVDIYDYAETHTTTCQPIKSDVETTDLSIVEQALLPATTTKDKEQCRCGLYIYDAFDRKLLFRKTFSPSIPLRIDEDIAKRWSAALVQFDVRFATTETIDLRAAS